MVVGDLRLPATLFRVDFAPAVPVLDLAAVVFGLVLSRPARLALVTMALALATAGLQLASAAAVDLVAECCVQASLDGFFHDAFSASLIAFHAMAPRHVRPPGRRGHIPREQFPSS